MMSVKMEEQNINVYPEHNELDISIFPEQNEMDISVTNEAVTLSLDYDKLYDKPKINGVELQGNQTSQELHIEGEANKINTIKVNNIPLTPDFNKAVNIKVPTKTSELTNDGNGKSPYATEQYVGEHSSKVDPATDEEYGVIKLDSASGITLNDDGQLEIEGGKFGLTEEGGLYSPFSLSPTLVGKNALLISGMSGLSVKNGTLALLRGADVTVKSAPAGTTEYHVANTYLNRLGCAGLQKEGAVCILNEDAESTGEFSNILSCKINGAAFTPDSSPDDPDNDIIITVDKSVNPDTTITQIRCYSAATKESSFFSGQMVGGYSGLANVIVGQRAFSDVGNVVIMVSADSYNNGNGNAIFGRYHNSRKNRWFMSGTGHDNTNGRTEAGAVVGQYSDIKPNTIFAVGDGSDQLNRSNAFEVTDYGVSLPKVNNLEIVDANLALTLNTTNYNRSNGTTIANGVATLPDNKSAAALTKRKPPIPVTAGEALNWSYEVRKTSEDVMCGQGLTLMKTNATGGSATNNWVQNGVASDYTTSWQTFSGTFIVPTGMEYMLPRIMTSIPTGAVATTGAYEVRNLKITRPGQASLVMSSPNGTRFKITVADDGTLGTEEI